MRVKPKALRLLCALILLLALCTTPVMATTGVTGDDPLVTSNWKYTATLDDTKITTTGMYVLLVLKEAPEGEFTFQADDIQYIDQGTPAENGTITFNGIDGRGFIPKTYAGGTAYIAGTELGGPALVGTLETHGVPVSGTITSYGNVSATTTIKLVQDTTLIDTDTGAGNSTAYSFATVSPEDYTLEVSKPGHATYTSTAFTVAGVEITGKNMTIYLYGDLNKDGVLTSKDTTQMKRAVAGILTLTGYDLAIADLNKDGSLTSKDTTQMKRAVAGILTFE